ncbi:MAG: LysR family transcriptional regulator, partial [Butyrivibrio sp.]
MIDIHLLEQFHAFYECGTLSAAAEHLHTSQPALTRAMKKLEEDLGVTLFIR